MDIGMLVALIILGLYVFELISKDLVAILVTTLLFVVVL